MSRIKMSWSDKIVAMTYDEVNEFILSLPDVKLEHPFGEDVAVFCIANSNERAEDRMFALIREGKVPVNLSLKCDPQLSKLLREKYETVMPGHHLNKKYWNTIILSGQLPWEEIQALIRHSYDLVAGHQ